MKIKRSVFALLLAAALLAGAIIGASSAGLQKTITATLRQDMNIEVDGVKQTLKDASGNTLYPIVYNNSTYVPFRAVGTLLGVGVDWDQNSQTAKYISNGGGNPAETETPSDDLGSSLDLIDKCKRGYWYRTDLVTSSGNKKIRLMDDAVDHWIRFADSSSNITFDLDGKQNTLTLRAYSNFDTVVTVYNNHTRDSVLGTFNVKGNASPSDHKIDLHGAFQIRIDVTPDPHAEGNFKNGDNYTYLYNAKLYEK